MFCGNCGNHPPEGSKFCQACGTPLQGQSGPLPETSPQPSPAKKSPVSPKQGLAIAAVVVIGLVAWGVGHRSSESGAPSADSQPGAQQSAAATGADHVKRATELAEKKDWASAIGELQEVKEGDPDYKTAQTKLIDYTNQLRAADIAEAKQKAVKAKDAKIRLREIAKAPNLHKGDLIAWSGSVMQISEDTNGTFAQIAYYEGGEPTGDNFFVNMPGHAEVYKDDYVRVYGSFEDMKDYTSQANYQLTSPVIKGFEMKKVQ